MQSIERKFHPAICTSKRPTLILLICILIIITTVIAQRSRPAKIIMKRRDDHKLSPSLSNIIPIDIDGKFTITSMAVEHGSDSRWYIPHYHDKHSAGYNRSLAKPAFGRPTACNIRFFATALESSLTRFVQGGTGYLTIDFKPDWSKKTMYHGFDKNETGKLHCYYMTNKGFGSEFIDSPKTLSVVVYCPVSLDDEIGPYSFRASMQTGYYCRLLSDYETHVSLVLRPTTFPVPLDYAQHFASTYGEITSDATSTPASARMLNVTDLSEEDRSGNMYAYRPHSVCTVQTFRNAQTGPMLYLFVSYYHRLGWKVIVYDRFGFHKEFIEDLLSLPGFDYHPYTMFQIVNPRKYSAEYGANQGFGYKIYYSMEKNWGYGKDTNGTLTDTADQDGDKARTYDHSRVEYSHLDTMLYIDSDELLYCPQAPTNVKAQRKYQQKMMHTFRSQGIEEMRVIRLPYAGLAPPGFNDSDPDSKSTTDFTLHTSACMQSAFTGRNVTSMLGCWSDASSYDDFPKSADMGGVCPFHYNHWSCDGMRGGGRDHERAARCRCKVAFDLVNHLSYQPDVTRCHLLHFNNNKYRFQLRRIESDIQRQKQKRVRQGLAPIPDGAPMSHGEVTVKCPMYKMFLNSNQQPH